MRASLTQAGVELDERDFFQDRLSEEELWDMIGDTPPSLVFSWSSPSFKKLGLAKDDLDDEQLIRLMLEEPRLIRRPLVRLGDEVVVGTRDIVAWLG